MYESEVRTRIVITCSVSYYYDWKSMRDRGNTMMPRAYEYRFICKVNDSHTVELHLFHKKKHVIQRYMS